MTITLKLTVEEVNIVLNALSSKPYIEVVELISKIQTDGDNQIAQSIEANTENEG